MLRLVIVQFLSAVGLKLWPYCEPLFKRYRTLGMALFLACVLGMIATLFLGCASRGQVTDNVALYTYKADIEVTVDSVRFQGMGVTLLNGPKTIALRSKAKLDLLTIASCHREFTVERVDYRSGWFGLGGSSSQEYVYQYNPNDIEKESYCPLYIQAYAKSGVAAWGYLAFRTTEKLPAKTECNGASRSFAGISVCQSKAGTEQAITFEKPVRFVANALCKVIPQSDRSFRVRTDKGFCYATFTDGIDRHRLVLLGYDRVLVRGE